MTAAQVGWFRRPRGSDHGTLNVSYTTLDRAVILGHGDELLLDEPTPVTFAGLLERVAALAGALGGLGAATGRLVLLDLPDDMDGVTARLACARVGATSAAVPVPLAAGFDEPSVLARLVDAVRPGLVVSARHDLVAAALELATHRPQGCIARGPATLDRTRDVDWETAITAGATEPAGCAAVPGEAAYSLAWDRAGEQLTPAVTTTGQRARNLAALVARAPVHLADLRAALED